MNTKFKKTAVLLVVVITTLSSSLNALAWSSANWKAVDDNGSGGGTGHWSLVDKMSESLFASPSAPNDTDFSTHKDIVAEAAYQTDYLDCMSAETGNTINLSPYHAKAELNGTTTGSKGYALSTVTNQHLKFLYELARRRLVLGSKLDLVSSNYSGDTYYGVTIGQTMKRRIVDDLVELNQELLNQGYDMSKVDHQGYMVLGVYFHLLEDIYAHRAEFTQSMVSNIDAAHINYTGTDTEKRTWLKGKIGTSGIPMIRLKDFLIDSGLSVSYTIGSVTNTVVCADNQAYEDNPFYFSARYTSAVDATNKEIREIMADIDDDNATDFSFPTYSSVHLN